MKRIYFIRHAPTIVNQTGEMMKDYRKVNINPLSRDEIYLWFNNVGRYIEKFNRVYISNTTRAYETSQLLMNSKNIIVNDDLNDIDCSALDGKKFWEISEDEFNKILKNKINLEEFDLNVVKFINNLLNLDENDEDEENLNKIDKSKSEKINQEINKSKFKNQEINKSKSEKINKSEINQEINKNIVCISHGLYIRHLYHLLTNNMANTLYKQINSVDFKFNPLDMLEIVFVKNDCKNKSLISQIFKKPLHLFDKNESSINFENYKIKSIKVYRYHED